MPLQFEWDPEKAVRDERTHRITFEEAPTVFGDPPATTVPDPEHSDIEKRWLTTGLS
jgi:uncharacterized DUF497 family protein